MAVSRFKHLLAGVICAAAIVGTAQAEPTALTPAMRTCLADAGLTEMLRPHKALHADEDTPEARGVAMVGRIIKACDVRPDELIAVRDFFVKFGEGLERRPDAVPAAKQPGPREIPLCVGNCR